MRSWHNISAEETLSQLETQPTGLSEAQVQQRLQEYGLNQLPEQKRSGPLRRFLLQFHNVLIYILIVAGLIKTFLGSLIDAGVIFGVVLINALIGFIQEGKAEKALDAIRQMMSLKALVRRNGQRIKVSTTQLVPGDVVLLASGDKVPADLRLIETRELQIDEAMLTGESMPAEKNTDSLPNHAPLGDRHCLAFSGTLVTSGRGVGVVVETGSRTELGKISDMVAETASITTPLIRKVNQFAHVLAFIIMGVSATTVLLGYWLRGTPIIDLFFAAIALAVAAIPEGLPAIMTIILAIGVRRMAQRNAIIRRLPAVDTLGALTVICSDKTGTLTRNEMTVTRLQLANADINVSGTGYEPLGNLQQNGQELRVDDSAQLRWMLTAGVLCNESDLSFFEGQWRSSGDPMESALLTLAGKAGIQFEEERQRWETLDIIPFESQNRMMATLHPIPADTSLPVTDPGERIIFVKGAPEKVLDCCQQVLSDDGVYPCQIEHWHSLEQKMAADGQRVLALACKPVSRQTSRIDWQDAQRDLTLLGLVGIIDPPREEAIEAVKICQDAGIRVVMITGDHALTARAIGEKLNIGDGQKALTGTEIDALDDQQLQTIAAECQVFARVSPEHKLRLVIAIQSLQQTVAMTGDGVNDAPALKRADVGIAMGLKGTEVTKEAAEMILADDNFASIAKAIEEGRTVYDNLRKALLFILPTNGGEALTIMAAILLGLALPMTPVQVLWVNMITAVTLGLALAFELPERNVMKRKPRNPQANLLDGYFIWRIIFVSLIMCCGTFGIFIWAKSQGISEQFARTLAVNTIVLFEAFYLFNSRFLHGSSFSLSGIFGSLPVLLSVGLVLLFQLLFTYWPVLQSLMGSVAIDFHYWPIMAVIASSVFWLVEIEKWIVNRWKLFD
jgi:magnesium-transporting ATPase (P-type)